MPFYTFRCCKCSHEIEVITKSSDKEDRMCPKCGCAMRRQFPLVASPGTTRDGRESGGGVDGSWTFGKQTGVGKLDGISVIFRKVGRIFGNENISRRRLHSL